MLWKNMVSRRSLYCPIAFCAAILRLNKACHRRRSVLAYADMAVARLVVRSPDGMTCCQGESISSDVLFEPGRL